MKKTAASALLLLFFLQAEKQNNILHVLDNSRKNDIVTMVFCGDVMGHLPQIQAAYNAEDGSYDYNICFEGVKQRIEEADIAVANLETTLAGKPYTGYPFFSSPDALPDALQYSGFDVILTANNHLADKGRKGFERTLQQIDKRGLMRAGSYLHPQERDSLYPLIIEKKGLRIALLNCTYGTNGMPVYAPNTVNTIDTAQIRGDVRKARERAADFIVMCIHWGNEYELRAGGTQRKLARFLAGEGVNLIVGSHPHVVQDREILYGKDSVEVPVYYSLGNFISNQRWRHSNGGILVQARIHAPSKKLLRTSYEPVYVHKGMLREKYQYHLIPTSAYWKNTSYYSLPAKDSAELAFFDTTTRKRLEEAY
ncbi:MAG: CapA family protein [Prevotellaceae bacterium]|jgi:poly-gamma-glutamate synthesis protein (capsule biosynthesis protein)|nr:CapA family protein [Prevotellaceae bacterium]